MSNDYFMDVNHNLYLEELEQYWLSDLDDEDWEIPFDCGYDPETGICSKAGSEDCDWDCPYRQALSN